MQGDTVLTTIPQMLASLYLRVVILTIFFYNYVLSIEDEITYIWMKPFAFGSVFYVIGRYLAAISLIVTYKKVGIYMIHYTYGYFGAGPLTWVLNDFGCQEMRFPYTMLTYTGTIVAVCAMTLLQLRTYVLYNKSKTVLVVFCLLDIVALVFFVVELTVLLLLRNDIAALTVVAEQDLGSQVYFHYYSPLFWSPFLLNEVVTFLMVFFKFIKTRQMFKGSRAVERNTTLYNVVIRDNMLYFLVIFVVYLSGFILFINPGTQEAFDGTHLLASIAVSGILAPNLLLMLKKGYYRQEQETILGLATGISAFHATVCHETGTHIANQDG